MSQVAKKTQSQKPLHLSGETLASIWNSVGEMEPASGIKTLLGSVSSGLEAAKRAPFSTLVTIGTISVALLLLAMVIIVAQNVQTFLGDANSDLTVSVFLSDDSAESERKSLEDTLRADPDVERIEYRSKQAALAEFRASLGENEEILEGLDVENPLPASIEVWIKEVGGDRLSEVASRYRTSAGVEEVLYSGELSSRLARAVSRFRIAAGACLLLVLIVTAWVISNTISLSVLSRKDEITILRDVGATTSYIRMPFLAEGMLQGLLGGIGALILAALVCVSLNESLLAQGAMFGNASKLQYLSPGAFILLLFTGLAVGLFGSYVAVARFLSIGRR